MISVLKLKSLFVHSSQSIILKLSFKFYCKTSECLKRLEKSYLIPGMCLSHNYTHAILWLTYIQQLQRRLEIMYLTIDVLQINII